VTWPVKGTLGYLKTTPPVKAGIIFNPGEGTFIKIQCGALIGEVKRSVLGEVSPLNVQQTAWGLTFKEAGGTQEWTRLVGETAVHNLEAFSESAILIATFSGFWNTEELEIRA